MAHQSLLNNMGGVEVYIHELSLALQQLGDEIQIFCGAETADEKNLDGLPLHMVKGGLGPKHSAIRNFMTTFRNASTERRFIELLEQYQPEVIHFHHLVGLSAALPSLAYRQKIPHLLTLHDYWFLCPNTQLLRPRGQLCKSNLAGLGCVQCAAAGGRPYLLPLAPLFAPLFLGRQYRLRRVLENMDIILAPSQFLKDTFERHDLAKGKIIVSTLGINKKALASQNRLEEKKRLRLGYIGAVAWAKGVEVLLRALRELDSNQVELYVYGDPHLYPSYWRRLQAYQLPNAYFMGKAQRDELGAVLSQLDCLVVPSRWYENSPVVVEEALAAGVPVIASRLGALEEKVSDGRDGLLFEAGNPQDLAQKIGWLLADRGLLHRLKQNLREVKSIEANAQELQEIYSRLASRAAQEIKLTSNR
ncbi:MAG: glycosyltransferase family 4 protein [Chloroflexi bacterium]|nr:glycosyltransferase family 4 protein [Chloroflexota bacterium]